MLNEKDIIIIIKETDFKVEMRLYKDRYLFLPQDEIAIKGSIKEVRDHYEIKGKKIIYEFNKYRKKVNADDYYKENIYHKEEIEIVFTSKFPYVKMIKVDVVYLYADRYFKTDKREDVEFNVPILQIEGEVFIHNVLDL